MEKDLATNFVIAQFTNLESQLQECLNFAPYISANKQLVSPKFIPILMESCSLIDSILRHYSGVGKQGNIRTFQVDCEPYFQLEEKVSLFLNTPIQLLRPFRDWHSKTPQWWAAYNEIKHDRIEKMASATFENTLMALCGLHQIIASYGIFIGVLLRAGWIDTTDEGVITTMAGISHVFSNPRLPDMAVESRLFVSPSRENFVREQSDSHPKYIEMDYDTANLSERVKNFLWAEEDF